MKEDYTKVDAPLDRFMGIKRIKNKKTKRYSIYMTTPVQPASITEPADDGYDSRRSQGPIARRKVKRYLKTA